MAARETGVVRFRFNGDQTAGQRYIGPARTQLGILKELMGFGGLPQLSRTVRLGDGTVIHCQSVFGQDIVTITPAIAAIEAPEEAAAEVAAVNRVTDYVGVAMPNPVPYRGVSIGVVDRGFPTVTSTWTATVRVGNTYTKTSSSTLRNSDGTTVNITHGTWTETWTYGPGAGDAHGEIVWDNFANDYGSSLITTLSGGGQIQAYLSGWPPTASDISEGVLLNGSAIYDQISWVGGWSGAVTFGAIGYSAELAAEVAAGTGGVRTYVMASDGTVLASEALNQVMVAGQMQYRYLPFGWENATNTGPNTFDLGNFVWGGDGQLWMMENNWHWLVSESNFNHKLTFTVPEDCVYPAPPAVTPAYPYSDSATQAAQWVSDWATGLTAFKTRRKAWFLKNSTEFIAALKGKFQPGTPGVTRAELQTGMLPASWDYQIKRQISAEYSNWWLADGSHPGRHTVMPIVMSINYTDTVQSDTSAGLTQAGTMVTQRAATFQYVDAGGVNRTATVNGTLTQVVTQHTQNGTNVAVSRRDTYANWYSLNVPAGQDALHAHQFLRDRAAEGLAQLWSGVVQNGYNANSAEGVPGNPLTYATYSPAYPAYSNTLVGTAAALYLQYHNTVLPQYVKDTAQSSTVMNNSAMYHVKQVELCLFGPAPSGQAIGIFPDPTDADGATQIAYYGEASFQFDWTTGSLSMLGWSPRKDANGNEAPTIIPMQAGYSYLNNGGTLYFIESVKTSTMQSAFAVIAAGGQKSDAAIAAGLSAYNATLASVGATGGDAAGKIIQTAVVNAVNGSPDTATKTLTFAVTAVLPAAIIRAIAAANVERAAVTPTPLPPLTTVALTLALQDSVAAYNCAVGYVWDSPDQLWPDVAEYLRAKIAQMLAGSGDQVLYTVIRQALQL